MSVRTRPPYVVRSFEDLDGKTEACQFQRADEAGNSSPNDDDVRIHIRSLR